MMLLAPTVVPPITSWSRSIRVKGQHTGATVIIFADEVRVGSVVAPSPDAFVPLDAGVALRSGQRVTAVQQRDGGTSGATAKASAPTVLNDPSPTTLGKIFSRSPLSTCATCLWLEGVVPGAGVTVAIGSQPPFTVLAEWTAVHVDVSLLATGEVVVVRQGRGAVFGPAVTFPPVLPLPEGLAIAPPRVVEPLLACDRTLELFDVQPGAAITVDHGGGRRTFCFGSTRGTFWTVRSLRADEVITTVQGFIECQRPLSGENRYEVSASPPSAPRFPYPVCAGDRDVEIDGLRTGALVQFLIGEGTGTVVSGEAGEQPFRFNLPPLGNVTRLGVRQTLCPDGPWSETAWVTLVAVGSLDSPNIDERPFDCGVAVGVAGLTAGTRASVVSRFWGGSIGNRVSIGDTYTDIPLYFPLVGGDTLSLELVRCGQLTVVADGLDVEPAPDELLAPLIFEPLDDAGGAITVDRLVPGALCDVERLDRADASEGVLITSQAVTRTQASVPVPPLPPGLFIRCRQRLCGRRSRPSVAAKTGDRWPEYVASSAERLVAMTGTRGTGTLPPRYDTTQVGLTGTDLGIPVVHGARLYFFFGDCDGDEDDDSVMDQDADPIAWTVEPPNAAGGPYLNFLVGSGGRFHRLHVDGLPRLGNFEVPTGAFSYDGRLYVFVAREKVPDDGPDARMHTSHLAITKQPGDINDNLDLLYNVASTLAKTPPFPAGRWLVHVSPTVVRCADWPGLPATSGDGLLLFGSELYHASNLYLAFCPLVYTSVSVPIGPGGGSTHVDPPVPHPSTWLYFVENQPATADYPANWRPAAALPAAGPKPMIAGIGLGEVSVTWHPRLRRWLCVRPGDGGVVVHSARDPRGPWSPATVIFNGSDPYFQATADNLQPGHRFVGLPHDWENRPTGVYAPYVVPSWTRFDGSIRTATLYYTLSTEHPPYNVQLMTARLRFR
jgi:hypothetical protein